MSIELRALSAEDYPAWIRAKFSGFGYGIPESQLLNTPVELDRSLAAYDSGRNRRHHQCPHLPDADPGGWLPMAGVAGVTVQPTHRRRGLMTRMMNPPAPGTCTTGESPPPVSTPPRASSTAGSDMGSLRSTSPGPIDRLRTQMLPGDPGSGGVEYVSRSEARDLFPEVREQACYGRAGAVHRRAARWELALGDPQDRDRRDRTRLIHAVYRDGSEVEGYALYRGPPPGPYRRRRGTLRHQRARPKSAVAVLLRSGPDDLHQAGHRPLEDPLLWMLADPRHLKRNSLRFSLASPH